MDSRKKKANMINNLPVNTGERVLFLQFAEAAQPSFVEKKGKPYVLFGEKNDYPDYLLYLYNHSAKHSAIINGKVNYIAGKGWTYDAESIDEAQKAKVKAFIDTANEEGETLLDITEKAALDLEIFNGAYLQIVWNKKKQIAGIYHLDFASVRSNKDNTEFYVSDEWVKYSPDGSYKPVSNPVYDTFLKFNPEKRTGTQILHMKRKHPGQDIYTIPNYRGSITWVEIDIEISKYHLSNVKSGFFVNKLINLNNGRPSEEEKKKIEKGFDDKFSGVGGRRYMFSFNAKAEEAATVEDLNVSESDKLFEQLNKTAQQEIFTGHNVTSPMLFGIKTEGQLGGRSELLDAYELFQNTYVNNKQQWIERCFNMLARVNGISTTLTIERTTPLSFQFSEAVQTQVMTKDEIRERVGLPAEQKVENTAAEKTIAAINSLSPLVANKVLENLTSDELRALINLPPSTEKVGTPPDQPPTQQFSAQDDEKDVQVFSEFGTARGEVTIIKSRKVRFQSDAEESRDYFADVVSGMTSIRESVLDLLVKDPLITPDVIAETLGIDAGVVTKAIDYLQESKLIEVTETKTGDDVTVERKPVAEAKKILRERPAETKSISVMYSYEGPKDSKNRPFCAKMLELDRLYSRADIERISERLGYSVWERRGGWYTEPNTNKRRRFCRHSWVSNVVVKKK